MLRHVRPHAIFGLVPRDDLVSVIPLPVTHSLTTMLERAVLTALVRLTRPQHIFEFGTYQGETTVLLAANSQAAVFTLDLDAAIRTQGERLFDQFESKNLKERLDNPPLFVGTQYEQRITQIVCDSLDYDEGALGKMVDFTLIDGGHNIEVVRSDTQKALKMRSNSERACIVWHDYGNTQYEITEYLEGLAQDMPLVHVEESQYVFWCPGLV
ncbi:class I SAM-dependent methyltransferase [Planctomycetota bacterium]